MNKKGKLYALSAEINDTGSVTVSAIKNGYRIHKTYIGYGKQEALRLFKRENK